MFMAYFNGSKKKLGLNGKKEQESDYSWWLFRKKNRIATAKELWNKPEVKSAIKAHNESVRQDQSTK